MKRGFYVYDFFMFTIARDVFRSSQQLVLFP